MKTSPLVCRAHVEPLETRIAPAFVTGVVNLAGINGTTGSAFHGAANGDSAGISVSAAGDVNGDGLGDFLIGASQDNVGNGAAYVIFGTAAGFPTDATLDATFVDGTKGFALVGEATGNQAGYSVSAAGDVNGDGFDDVIVGAKSADGAASTSGAAYVVFGQTGGFAATVALGSLDGSDGFKLSGAAFIDRAGTSVSGAGDVNGDGFDDVIVGANQVGGKGAAFIIYGKAGGFAANLTLSGLTAAQGVQLDGVAASDNAGFSVSGAGDVNGDGFDDVVVGARLADDSGNSSGAAYVVFGGSALPATIALGSLGGSSGFCATGAAATDYAGWSVSGAGDVNGDGLADVLVGALGAGAGGFLDSPGAAYVIFGSAAPFAPQFSLDTSGAVLRLDGAAGDVAGFSVKRAGDVNGDGIDDLIVGAPQNTVSGGTGGAYVVFGRANLATTPPLLSALDGSNGFRLAGEEADSRTGRAVSGAGDVNGDGFADLLVGAPFSADGGADRGQSYLVYGGPSGVFITPTIAANGKTATWTDVDGDLVTVKVSVGTLDASNFELLANSATDSRARLLKLHVDTPEFKGANVSITAKRAGGGDGRVNVGVLSGSNTDLGAVTIGGDLDHIFAGDNVAGLGLKSLTVGSIGAFGGRTADTGIRYSVVAGGMGALKVAGDMAGGNFGVYRVSGATSGGDIASVTIGGSLLGGKTAASGSIGAADRIGAVKISGDVRGGAGERSATLEAGSIASLTIGGSLIGSTGDTNARVSAGSIGSITIGGSQVGGAGWNSGSIFSFGNIGKVTIKGDQLGGAGLASGLLFADSGGNIASVTIGGDVRGGRTYFSGGILADGTLGPVSVKGDVLGTAEQPFFIRGGGPLAGTKSVAIAGVKVGGDFERVVVLGGYTIDNEGSNGHAQIGAISVGGDWIASSVTAGLLPHAGAEDAAGVFGDGDEAFIVAGAATNAASITSVKIKGAARGTFADGDRFGIVAEQIGSVSIGGVKVPLTTGAANDLAAIHVGATPDFVVREISRTAAQPGEPAVTIPAAGLRTAQPGVVAVSALTGGDGFKLSGLANDDYAGYSARAAGDVNGDGFQDLIMGARGADEGGTDRGAAYVVFGKAGGFGASVALSGLDGTNGFKLSGVANADATGDFVSGAGDVNGDGFDDLIVSAPRADEGGTDRGAAYVVFGAASFAGNVPLSGLDGTNGFKIGGTEDGARAGGAVAAAGDVNGDGFADVIVGAYRADAGGTDRGAAYVIFGKRSGFGASLSLAALDGSNGFMLGGAANDDATGSSVSAAGDVNGDGLDDLIVGAPRTAEGGTRRGAAYVIYGSRDDFDPSLSLGMLDPAIGFTISGVEDDGRLGASVGAGDVNGDGLSDVILGAYNANAAYVVLGRASSFGAGLLVSALDGNTGFKLSGVAAGDDTGRSVGGAGDVNGDGFADLIVGARDAADGGNRRGASYVVFGKANGFDVDIALGSLDGADGFKLSIAEDDSRFGGGVGTVGDVNGDGFDDVIASAFRADEGGTDRGAAFVVFGGPSGEFIDPTFSADGRTATWTDVDGDRVTLKVSKTTGTLDATNFRLLANSTTDARAQFLALNLAAEFEGADLSITAKRAVGGDGKVNVGFLNAFFVDLGRVTVGGDLGKISVGDGDAVAPFKSLTVGSIGVFGGRTQDTGGNLTSQIFGPAGAVKVAGDVREAFLGVGDGGVPGNGALASVTIGGSLIGGKTAASGAIAANSLGPVKIGGDLIGGAGSNSGYIQVASGLTSLTLGGSMLGGGGAFSGAVQSFAGVGNVTLGGSQLGGDGDASGAIFTAGSIGKVSIKGDQIGRGLASAIIFANGGESNIASVTIGGDARGGSVAFSGGILAGGTLGPVSIKGDVTGTTEQAFLIRGGGPLTGTTSPAIASVKVGGDFDHALILAGYGANNVPVNGHAQIGAISVGGDWIASSITAGLLPFANATGPVGVFGNGDDVFIAGGPAGVIASIASITIKGRAIGTHAGGDFYGIVAEQIGRVKVGGVKLAFTSGPGNGDSLFVGPTPDFAIFEVARV